MTILSYQDRQAHWEWCREYIDRQCIWRAGQRHLVSPVGGEARPAGVPGKAKGATYIWQFYLRRGTLHADFSRRLGLFFWDHFAPVFARQPFQIAACVPSGAPIAIAIQSAARAVGITVRDPETSKTYGTVNAFLVRREPKAFGTDNWFDGRALPDVPVLLVDDAAASAPFLLCASARVQHKLRLPLHYQYFVMVNKVGRGFDRASQHTENYPPGQQIALYTMNDFCKSVEQFRERYGEEPKWTGVVR